eukprot:1158117-Pelagomonas_calceolata.AAC.3
MNVGNGAMVQGFLVPVKRLNSGTGHGEDGLITKVSLQDRNVSLNIRINLDNGADGLVTSMPLKDKNICLKR